MFAIIFIILILAIYTISLNIWGRIYPSITTNSLFIILILLLILAVFIYHVVKGNIDEYVAEQKSQLKTKIFELKAEITENTLNSVNNYFGGDKSVETFDKLRNTIVNSVTSDINKIGVKVLESDLVGDAIKRIKKESEKLGNLIASDTISKIKEFLEDEEKMEDINKVRDKIVSIINEDINKIAKTARESISVKDLFAILTGNTSSSEQGGSQSRGSLLNRIFGKRDVENTELQNM